MHLKRVHFTADYSKELFLSNMRRLVTNLCDPSSLGMCDGNSCGSGRERNLIRFSSKSTKCFFLARREFVAQRGKGRARHVRVNGKY